MPYIGYRKIAGSDLTAEIYHDVARFLFEVHQALPVDEAARIGVPMAEPHTHLEVVERLHPRIDDAAVAGFAAATIDEYSQLIATEGPPSFLHNDLHGDNMAFDARASRLNGVFDFGDAAIGDVHRDFSPLYKVHRGLLEDVVREYGTLSGTNLSLRRIVVYQRIDRLTDIAQLIDRPDEPELAKAVGDLRRWAREQSVYAP
jgi:aminoglycoside phosphotransferase (APT) family kinase protein